MKKRMRLPHTNVESTSARENDLAGGDQSYLMIVPSQIIAVHQPPRTAHRDSKV